MASDSDRLREIAAEIASGGHAGWGNALEEIAARLDAAPAQPGVPAEVVEAASAVCSIERLTFPSEEQSDTYFRAARRVARWILSQLAALSPPPPEREEERCDPGS